jgi:hypothetical protein
MSTSFSSEHIPPILGKALKTLQAQKAPRSITASSVNTKVPPASITKRDPNRIPLRVAQSRRKLIARGAGVYEDPKSGDIWYREGEFLIRQAIDVSSIVEKYLDSCKGT